MRVDKWLWAARLVKTRALAVEAIKGGRVQVNGERAKPSRLVRPGDDVVYSAGRFKTSVVVRATSLRRASASEAAELYEETADSRAERERIAAELRAERAARGQREGGRPTKRDRRRLEAARRERPG